MTDNRANFHWTIKANKKSEIVFKPFTVDLEKIKKLFTEHEYNAIRLVRDSELEVDAYNNIAKHYLYDTLIKGNLYTYEETKNIIDNNKQVMKESVLKAYAIFEKDYESWWEKVSKQENREMIAKLEEYLKEEPTPTTNKFYNAQGYNPDTKTYATVSYFDKRTQELVTFYNVDKAKFQEIRTNLINSYKQPQNNKQTVIFVPYKKPIPKPKARIKKPITHHDDIQKGIKDSLKGKSAVFSDTYMDAFNNYHDSTLDRYFDDNGHPTRQQRVLRCELATLLENTYNI